VGVCLLPEEEERGGGGGAAFYGRNPHVTRRFGKRKRGKEEGVGVPGPPPRPSLSCPRRRGGWVGKTPPVLTRTPGTLAWCLRQTRRKKKKGRGRGKRGGETKHEAPTDILVHRRPHRYLGKKGEEKGKKREEKRNGAISARARGSLSLERKGKGKERKKKQPLSRSCGDSAEVRKEKGGGGKNASGQAYVDAGMRQPTRKGKEERKKGGGGEAQAGPLRRELAAYD